MSNMNAKWDLAESVNYNWHFKIESMGLEEKMLKIERDGKKRQKRHALWALIPAIAIHPSGHFNRIRNLDLLH